MPVAVRILAQRLHAIRSLARRTSPLFAEFHVTARCHHACRACNIVYAHGAVPELALDAIRSAAANLAEIGVGTVLLTGGEPFARADLPEIVEAFASLGIRTQLQTAGLVSLDALERCIDAGARDLSVSLDTLDPGLQERMNGDVAGSWDRAIDAIAAIGARVPAHGTATLAALFAPGNFEHVPQVTELATAIGWSISISPLHASLDGPPRPFRAHDPSGALRFAPESRERVRAVVVALEELRRGGADLVEPPRYFDDLLRFTAGEPVRWRARNGDVCDAASLYFTIDPAGRVAPCRDFHLDEPLEVHDERFPTWFRDGVVERASRSLVEACEGCAYSPYASITRSARAWVPSVRPGLAVRAPRRRPIAMSAEKLRELTREIRSRASRDAA